MAFLPYPLRLLGYGKNAIPSYWSVVAWVWKDAIPSYYYS